MTDVRRTVHDYVLRTFLPGEDPSALTETTPLITSGVLDSLAVLELVDFLEKHYDIELEASDLDPTRFGTIVDVARLIESKLPTR